LEHKRKKGAFVKKFHILKQNLFTFFPFCATISSLFFERTRKGMFILLVTTALSLAMDAFSVSVCKGLATKDLKAKHMLITGAWFGGFQALMPLIGYYVGALFRDYAQAFDHWIIFALLALIGANMIKESFEGDECPANAGSFTFATMLTMALATSIDALAVGISFSLMPEVNIFVAILLIGVITFILSALGVKVGSHFGSKYKSTAELIGGIVLILLGIKILVEHLFSIDIPLI
jgi:putative Mn2+ efflux pump MntP